MIDPPRIANLLSVGQHNLNYFVVRKRRNKSVIKVMLSFVLYCTKMLKCNLNTTIFSCGKKFDRGRF